MKRIVNKKKTGENIKKLCESHGITLIDLQGMAVSKSHFFRTYKKYFMISCAADIISARIKKATELLKYTDLNISEIALICGYSTENYFTRQFRDSMGMTASQYRAKHKK